MNLTDRTVPEHPEKAAEPDSIPLPTDDASAFTFVVSAQALPVENSTASLKAGLVDISEVRPPSRDEMLVAGCLWAASVFDSRLLQVSS